MLLAVDDYLADVLAVEHHVQRLFNLAQGQSVGDHAVKVKLTPVVGDELCAELKLLLSVQAVADEGLLLEGNLADDELILIAGEVEAHHLIAAAAEVGHHEGGARGSGGVEHDIEATAAGDFTHEVHSVGLGGVDGLNAHGFNKLTARLVNLGDDNAACAPGSCKDGDVKAHSGAAGDKHGVTLLDLAGHHHKLFNGHVNSVGAHGDVTVCAEVLCLHYLKAGAGEVGGVALLDGKAEGLVQALADIEGLVSVVAVYADMGKFKAQHTGSRGKAQLGDLVKVAGGDVGLGADPAAAHGVDIGAGRKLADIVVVDTAGRNELDAAEGPCMSALADMIKSPSS